jgi:hypothetical protein
MILALVKSLALAIILITLSAGAEVCETPGGWHLDRLDQEQGLDACYRPNVKPRVKPVLYVIDSGVYGGHSEFTSKSNPVINGYNFAQNSWDSGDCSGHGSHVAAIAAGGFFISIAEILHRAILRCERRNLALPLTYMLPFVPTVPHSKGKKFGVAGSIPVDIVSVRILDCQGRGSCSSMIKAMDWVYLNRSFTF